MKFSVKKGSLKLSDIIHIFDEDEVVPRKSDKYGAGYGMRNISLYSSSLEIVVTTSEKTQVTAVIPFRGRDLQCFNFKFRSVSDV